MLPPELLGACLYQGLGGVVADPVIDESMGFDTGWVTASRRSARLTINGTGTFASTDGRRINIALVPAADPLLVDAWLYGGFVALLLGQQHRFALHATTVEIAGTSVAIAGLSGSGKSTTAFELLRRGHRLVADDVSAISGVKRGGPLTVVPFNRPVHLWPETAAALGLDLPPTARTLPGTGKLVLPPPVAAPVLLAAIVVLQSDDHSVGLTARQLPVLEAVRAVASQVYRQHTVDRLWPAEAFKWAVALAGAIPVHLVTRPMVAWTSREVADAVEELATAHPMPRPA